jgi:hypothetical protein
VLAHYPEDHVTIAVLLNTERANAQVTAAEIEERIARVFFGLPEPPATPVPVPVSDEELRRYAGRYHDGPRVVDLAAADGVLRRRSGPHGSGKTFVPQGGQVFLDGEEPSVQLRFQVGGGGTVGYGRYHNGWFVGLGVRAGDAPDAAARP